MMKRGIVLVVAAVAAILAVAPALTTTIKYEVPVTAQSLPRLLQHIYIDLRGLLPRQNFPSLCPASGVRRGSRAVLGRSSVNTVCIARIAFALELA